ncbi:radical SAM protein [Sulfolobales archaeon HS-7]|nr:radical SAM protein [Sulfolobales archaeon HS-7]
MMNSIVGNPEVGIYRGRLPIGCELCRIGAKLVIFVTGECGDNCFYCPVSEKRFGKDRIFANESEVNDTNEIIWEAYRMSALGASITGGDPLLHLDRTVKIVTALKEEFGSQFHIHLYTSGRYATTDAIRELAYAGLDEIRFHPINEKYLKFAERATTFDIDVGIEIPAVPGQEKFIIDVIKWAENNKVKFVNINELEVTERNYTNLLPMGIKVEHGIAGGSKSAELAIGIVKELEPSKISLHYCSSVYKDIVETRTRFIRTAKNVRKPYEEITGEGTIIRLVTKKWNRDLETYGEVIGNELHLSPNLDKEILHSIDEAWLVETHPDARRLEISRTRIRYPES